MHGTDDHKFKDVADGSVMVFIVDSSRLSRGAFLFERTITCHVEPLDYRDSRTAPISPARLIEDCESPMHVLLLN